MDSASSVLDISGRVISNVNSIRSSSASAPWDILHFTTAAGTDTFMSFVRHNTLITVDLQCTMDMNNNTIQGLSELRAEAGTGFDIMTSGGYHGCF